MPRKLKLQDCIDVAILKGGKCLETAYINSQTPMMWECKYGHQWQNQFNNMKNRGDWCKTCAGNQLKTIHECIDWAISKGGKCLETAYINNQTPMLWECM